MTYTESSQKHRVQQQDHSLIRLTVDGEADSEDEDVEEALDVEKVLVVVADQSLVITAEL